MAISYLNDINLNQNELQNAVIQSLGAEPSSGKAGQVYYNNGSINAANKGLWLYNGSQWVRVGTTYDLSAGTVSSNTVPINLVGGDGTTDTVNIKGAGGATITQSNGTITITTSDNNTTYTFSGALDGSNGYKVTITPSTGSAQTYTIPMVSTSDNGLMSSSDKTKLNGIQIKNATLGLSSTGGDTSYKLKLDYNDGTSSSVGYVSGVKGNAESSYRTGNVNLTPANLGINTGTIEQLRAGTDTDDRVWKAQSIHDYVGEAIAASDAMVFKGTLGTGGTVTALPTTYQIGWTYRVITAGTYAGQACEVGDLVIALVDRSGSGNLNSDWTVAQTNIDGAITSITGTSPISVTGSGASRTVAHANSGVTAASKGDTSNQTPTWGGTFKVLSGTVNATGHLTAFAEHTVKIPNTEATVMERGLMSAADKQALSNLINQSQFNRYITTNSQQLSPSSGICTWTITITDNVTSDSYPIVQVFTVDGKQVMTEVDAVLTATTSGNSLTVTIKIISASAILVDTYRAVVFY